MSETASSCSGSIASRRVAYFRNRTFSLPRWRPTPARTPPARIGQSLLDLGQTLVVDIVVRIPGNALPILLESLAPAGIDEEDPGYLLGNDLLDAEIHLLPPLSERRDE